MIKFIAAVDSKMGIANEQGIPWAGKLPQDVAYFRRQTDGSTILMGMGVYGELTKSLPNRLNYVASNQIGLQLKPGFILVNDPKSFIQNSTTDVWVIGGATIFASLIDLAEEIYLTHINKDFHCTKFFPNVLNQFKLKNKSSKFNQNGLQFYFAEYTRIGD